MSLQALLVLINRIAATSVGRMCPVSPWLPLLMCRLTLHLKENFSTLYEQARDDKEILERSNAELSGS